MPLTKKSLNIEIFEPELSNSSQLIPEQIILGPLILGPLILGIETSCDETSASIYDTKNKLVLSNVTFSQIDMHKHFGGVIPEIASRAQLEKISPIISEAFEQANITLEQILKQKSVTYDKTNETLDKTHIIYNKTNETHDKNHITLKQIDAIAVSKNPGLPGSLLVGLCFAKNMAYGAKKNLIGINHLEAHAFSPLIENDINFPHICLTASGGHTNLYLIKNFGEYELLGQTLDDAAGEAFDKIAKMLNLDYPGGPLIEKLASEVNFQDFYKYPRGRLRSLDFSFSGLKTAVLYDLVAKNAYDMTSKKFLGDNIIHDLKIPDLKQKVSSSLLVCIADIFKQKIKLALEKYPEVKAVSMAGGVACNKYIKAQISSLCDKKGVKFYYPSPKYCTDNAAMIAFVGAYKYQQNKFDNFELDIFE